ncbi:LysR family transcriptional regulator [Brucellaceae bacterium VT-16-1752]|nr:LysR family transcriptional regulator [Brucellaceae bacterium VT-16-1752]
MRFKLRQMEVFRAVMLTGSMSAAARLLNISQPAISRLVAYTEQTLGLTLFERSGGKLVPTMEAQMLVSEVEKLFEEARHVDELARELAKRPGGTLTIAASPSLALGFMPPVIAGFLVAHPQVHVRYHTTLLADMVRELIGRQANLAISVLPLEDPGIICDPLAEGSMVCVAPASHVIAAQKSISLEQIGPYPLVMYDRAIPFGRLIGRAFETASIVPRIVMEIPRAELAIAMVRAGIGLAIVDEFAVAGGMAPDLISIPIVEPIGITLSLLQSRYGPPQSQNARAFIELLKSRLKRRKSTS